MVLLALSHRLSLVAGRRHANRVKQELLWLRSACCSVGETEPSQVDRQVFRGDASDGPQALLDATVQSVDVLDVVRPKLVRATRDLPNHDTECFSGCLICAGGVGHEDRIGLQDGA